MSTFGHRAELFWLPFRAGWRVAAGWAVALVLLVVSTIAFWPAFKGTTALNDALKVLPAGMLEAFGLQDFASPAGYLRGGLYELIVPLMFAAAGVMLANSATASEEDAGRLELFLAQPVTRRAFMTARALTVVAWLAVLAVLVLVSQLASDTGFGLEIDTARILSTIVLCALLGGLFASLGIAVAGLVGRPGQVLAIGLTITLLSYLMSALFPLSAVLEPWRGVSPWAWALSNDPLVNVAEPWRYAALVAPAVLLTLAGVVAFDRRDIRSA